MVEYIKKTKGNKAEKAAVRFLKKQGLKIISRNFTCKTGEIDIIAYDKQFKELVFVEVRFRQSGIDSAFESIKFSKQRRIIKSARFFLLINPQYAGEFIRFDIIALSLDDNNKFLLKHVPDAFRE
jgi:putative endonuclease